jgi:hypothetical protein
VASCIQQQVGMKASSVQFAGTLVDMALKFKIEIHFNFEPEKYPEGAKLVINNGKFNQKGKFIYNQESQILNFA